MKIINYARYIVKHIYENKYKKRKKYLKNRMTQKDDPEKV
jgi:hypothetical protein